MKQVTASGKTVDEAIESAVDMLQTTKDRVDVHIVDEGRKGVLGIFGAKRAIVQATLRKSPAQLAETYLREIAENLVSNPHIILQEKGKRIRFIIEADNSDMLLEDNGRPLNALQDLVELYIRDAGSKYAQVEIDAAGYREKRRAELKAIAEELADRAVQSGNKTACDPMPSFERKWVHACLQRRKDITTKSVGKEPYRHIIIEPNH